MVQDGVDVGGVQMASVSKLLDEIRTPAAKKAKPTLARRMKYWRGLFQWPAGSHRKHGSAAARTGGGQPGHVAIEAALRDIYGYF